MKKILLVGAGLMAKEYAKVLKHLKIKMIVLGRSKKGCESFYNETKTKAIPNGLDCLKKKQIENDFTKAIIATNVENLASTCLILSKLGLKEILLEKPGGVDFDELKSLEKKLHGKTKVYIAYNRRHFASTKKVKEIIKNDGGVSSFHFEFTELSHIIGKLKKDNRVKSNWFLANSTHVVDLAFYLGGEPREFSSFKRGKLPWHKNGSKFVGAGVSKNDALFSYNADWKSPGRWSVEIMTKKHRLFLCPLETLRVQNLGEFSIKEIKLEDEYERMFKPGLYSQVLEFLSIRKTNLVSLKEQTNTLEIYKKMLVLK